MDARGGSNGDGRDDRIPPDQEGPRLARGRSAGRSSPGGSDQTMMAVPTGPGPEMVGAETGASGGGDASASFRGWPEPAPVANPPERCKFLRSIGPDGKLSDPIHEAVPTHRCAAFGDPLPLSLRQQELVCLQRVHVSCPRYMRGTLLAEESATAAAEEEPKAGLPILTIAGLILVGIAGLILVAALMGILPGIHRSSGSAGPSQVAVVTASHTAPATPTLAPSPSPAVEPTATPAPSASPSPLPTSTPVASPTWPPGATASRMKLLVPCPGQADCYLYTVRGAGVNGSSVPDNVGGIARFFGVDVDAIYAMNPWATSGIQPGQKLKIPPPTR